MWGGARVPATLERRPAFSSPPGDGTLTTTLPHAVVGVTRSREVPSCSALLLVTSINDRTGQSYAQRT
jgi:hypothetical protein